jgi:hypothetical protein
LSNTEKQKKEPPYTIKGIPIHGFVTGTGDFGWIPDASACGDKEHALEILEVLANMSKDKGRVWIDRFDAEKTIPVCPIIKEDQNVSQAYAELFSPQDPSKSRNTKHAQEVRDQNEQK